MWCLNKKSCNQHRKLAQCQIFKNFDFWWKSVMLIAVNDNLQTSFSIASFNARTFEKKILNQIQFRSCSSPKNHKSIYQIQLMQTRCTVLHNDVCSQLKSHAATILIHYEDWAWFLLKTRHNFRHLSKQNFLNKTTYFGFRSEPQKFPGSLKTQFDMFTQGEENSVFPRNVFMSHVFEQWRCSGNRGNCKT